MRADTADRARCRSHRAGIELVGTGLDPRGDVARVVDEPRYAAMEAYFDTAWPAGRTMMRNTASIQVNLDVGAPYEVDARWHRAHDLGPVLAACFANSPFDAAGRPVGLALDARRGVARHRSRPHRVGAAPRPTSAARVDWTPVRARRAGDDDPRRRRRTASPCAHLTRSSGGSTTATRSAGRRSTTSPTTSPRCSRRCGRAAGSSCA